MKLIKIIVLSLLMASCTIHSAPNRSASNGTLQLVSWNKQLIAAADAEDGLLTLKGLRTASMAHIAIHDGLNSIEPQYRPFVYIHSEPRANPAATIAGAAYTIAVHQFPDLIVRWQEERDKWLAESVGDEAVRLGLALGQAAAEKVITSRQSDNWDIEVDYQWHPMAPGVYAEFNEHSGTPKGFIFGAGWAKAEPFVLSSQDQFLSPPPPAIDSTAYLSAYNEVKIVGRNESEQRTVDQTHLAIWWKDFAENSHNRLARRLIVERKLDITRAARLMALLNISIYDGYISVFHNKFLYNHWRPYTAIRWAEHDGNPLTVPELEWTNTHNHTYAFPSYPSAHGTVCAAAMTVLADTFGSDSAFTMSVPVAGSTGSLPPHMSTQSRDRSFSSFAEAAVECGASRVYLGIHFRYDSVEGVDLGNRIGRYVLSKTSQ